MNFPVKITNLAIEQLRQVRRIHNHTEVPFIRIGIKGGGGCGGVANFIALDEKSEKDIIYDYENLQFAIEKGHLMYLVGLQIDYVENETDKGFVFITETKSSKQ